MNDLQEFKTGNKIKRTFNTQLDEIFSEPYNFHQIEIEEEQIKKAQVNTNEKLDKAQMGLIVILSEEYGIDFQISRSGAGIKIEFKENQE